MPFPRHDDICLCVADFKYIETYKSFEKTVFSIQQVMIFAFQSQSKPFTWKQHLFAFCFCALLDDEISKNF